MRATPRLSDHRLNAGAAALEYGRLTPFGLRKCIKRAILAVDDVDLVMAVRLGEENAEIAVSEVEIDGFVGDLDDGIIPPSDALLFVEDAGDALIERVLEKGALAFGRSLVRRPTRIRNDGQQE